MPAKKKPKYDPKDKFVTDGADLTVWDKDGKVIPNKWTPPSFTELPYDVDDNGNAVPPPKQD